MLNEKIFSLTPVLIAPLSLNSHRSRTSMISCFLNWFHLYWDRDRLEWRLWYCCSGSCGCPLSLNSLLLFVAMAHYLGARCCCLPSVHSISCRWPHLHQGRHLWHQPSHIYNLVMRCVEAHETFVNCHFSNHTFDVIYSPSVVHILSPCCTFMNSWQFTSISSEKKICVNSKT